MTKVYEQETRCALCNSENKFRYVATTSAFGSEDLDTRPPQMQRSTMFTWVQRCSKCGYCSSDVSKSKEPDGTILCSWECDKVLLAASVMAEDDHTDAITLLLKNGLQCKTPPADFYLAAVDNIIDAKGETTWSGFIYTCDDQQIAFYEKEGDCFARLK